MKQAIILAPNQKRLPRHVVSELSEHHKPMPKRPRVNWQAIGEYDRLGRDPLSAMLHESGFSVQVQR